MSDSIAQVEQVNNALQDKEGKYLTIALGHEEFGLEMITEEVTEAEAEAILQYLLREDRNTKETSK